MIYLHGGYDKVLGVFLASGSWHRERGSVFGDGRDTKNSASSLRSLSITIWTYITCMFGGNKAIRTRMANGNTALKQATDDGVVALERPSP